LFLLTQKVDDGKNLPPIINRELNVMGLYRKTNEGKPYAGYPAQALLRREEIRDVGPAKQGPARIARFAFVEGLSRCS